MYYPKRLQFTEVEETAMLASMERFTVQEVLEEVDWAEENSDLDDESTLRQTIQAVTDCIQGEFGESKGVLTEELDFQETVDFKLKLEGRKKWRNQADELF
jgi:hypothetical protein